MTSHTRSSIADAKNMQNYFCILDRNKVDQKYYTEK